MDRLIYEYLALILALLGAVAVISALWATPVLRSLFRQLGIVDRPDGFRKLHRGPIPRVGGLVLAVGYASCLAVPLIFQLSPVGSEQFRHLLRLTPAIAVTWLLGLFDDIFTLRARFKLVVQVLAAVMVILAGFTIQLHLNSPLGSGLEVAITGFWIVFCTNAFNLIDGMDGAAAGLGLIGTVTVVAVGLWSGNLALAIAAIPLAGSLLGILFYNFNPASIFLGDCGSYSIGMLLACFGVIWSRQARNPAGMLAPVVAFSVPLLDVCLSVMRRYLRKRPLFKADRGHIHHKLLSSGLTTRQAALLLYAAAVLCSALGLSLNASHIRSSVILGSYCLLLVGATRALGYEEFKVMLRMMHPREFRSALNTHLAIRSIEDRMRMAHGSTEQWETLQDACKQLGYCRVRIELTWGVLESLTRVAPSRVECRLSRCDTCRRSCAISVPINGTTKLLLNHEMEGTPLQGARIIPFASLLRQTLTMNEAFTGPAAMAVAGHKQSPAPPLSFMDDQLQSGLH